MASNGGPRKVFGQTMHRKPGRSNYQRQFGGGGGRTSFKNTSYDESRNEESEAAKQAARRRVRQEQGEAIDANFGYNRLEDKTLLTGNDKNQQDVVERRGWLFHMLPTTVRADLYGSY